MAATRYPLILCLTASLLTSGCTVVVERFSDNLSGAVLEHDDPETIRDAAPAYLLLIDSVVRNSPDSTSALAAGARLYAAYSAIFVTDPKRMRRLSKRALDYGQRAACERIDEMCETGLPFQRFEMLVSEIRPRDMDAMHAYSLAWLSYIRAHSGDWRAIADLPRVETLLARLIEIDESHDNGSLQLYMGILKTLRPPALGGEPEVGRRHFERAIELSDGRNLAAKVEFARSYARGVYDRELHDRLLEEVLAAEPEAGPYTLLNVIAIQQAEELLATADGYF